MTTDELILSLARDTPVVSRHALGQRIAFGVLAGGAVSLLLVVTMLDIRPDISVAIYSFSFWMKWLYAASLGVGAIGLITSLARPDSTGPRWPWLLAVPILLLAAISVAELAHTPPADWLAMWLGNSWRSCPGRLLLLSAPIFLGLLWSFQRLAPTRLRMAGAAAGLAAGSWAAALYCLHCPEVSAVFVLTWYSLGIGLAVAIGALLGPQLLRW